MPDMGTTFARMGESWDSDSPTGRGARVSFRSGRPPLAVVEVTSQTTYVQKLREKWNAYPRSGVSTYVTVHRGGIERQCRASPGSARWFPE